MPLPLPTMRSRAYSIPVTLTPTHDEEDRRSVVLIQGEGVTIGRASRSEIRNLRASANNALFDCPVVSRQHAELNIHPYKPKDEQVTITDRESMHGTYVNENRLEPHKPVTLRSGDSIKLGDTVTRGSDIHDGIELLFQLQDPPALSRQPPATNTNGFKVSVPTDSDDESDMASDDGFDAPSVFSKYGIATSSAQTTPEQPKAIPGSQKQPIDVETTKASVPEVIDLVSDEPIVVSHRKTPSSTAGIPSAPTSAGDKAPMTARGTLHAELRKYGVDVDIDDDADSVMVHNTGLSQILDAEVDEDAEAEDDYLAADDVDEDESQDADNLSESDASDLSNHDIESPEASDDEDEDEYPDVMSSKRQASEELGEPESQCIKETLFETPLLSTTLPSTAAYGPPQAISHSSAAPQSTAQPRYDPIRSLDDDDDSSCVVLSSQPATQRSAYPYPVHSAPSIMPPTNSMDSSAWNMGACYPPPVTMPYAPAWKGVMPPPPAFPQYTMPPPPTFTAAAPPSHSQMPLFNCYLPGSDEQSVPRPQLKPRPTLNRYAPPEPPKSRISIDSITDQGLPTDPLLVGRTTDKEIPKMDNSTQQAINKLASSPHMVNVAAGSKRKADAISDDPVPLPQSEQWAQLDTALKSAERSIRSNDADWASLYNAVQSTQEATEDAQAPEPEAVAQSPAAKKARISALGAVKSVAKYAAVATAGGVGTVAFLASPYAQQLLEWLP